MSQSSSVATSAVDMGTGDTYVVPAASIQGSNQTWWLIIGGALAAAVILYLLLRRK
jgi:LPXTG-motif cell wall-anchored protein